MHGSHVLVLRYSGIGPKRGVELIQQYKSIDEILKHKSKLPSVSVAVQLQHGTPTLPPIPCSTHCHHPPIPCPSLHPHLPPLPLMPPSPPTPAPHATLTSHPLLHTLPSSSHSLTLTPPSPPIPCPSLHPHLPPLPLMPPSPPIPCSTHCHHPPIPCPSLHPHLPPLPLMPPSPPIPCSTHCHHPPIP